MWVYGWRSTSIGATLSELYDNRMPFVTVCTIRQANERAGVHDTLIRAEADAQHCRGHPLICSRVVLANSTDIVHVV
jgi:hypothetical protein